MCMCVRRGLKHNGSACQHLDFFVCLEIVPLPRQPLHDVDGEITISHFVMEGCVLAKPVSSRVSIPTMSSLRSAIFPFSPSFTVARSSLFVIYLDRDSSFETMIISASLDEKLCFLNISQALIATRPIETPLCSQAYHLQRHGIIHDLMPQVENPAT